MLTAVLLAATAVPFSLQNSLPAGALAHSEATQQPFGARAGFASQAAIRPDPSGSFLGTCQPGSTGFPWGNTPFPGFGDEPVDRDILNGPGLYCWDNTVATSGTQGQDSPWCNGFGTPMFENDIWALYTPTATGPFVLEVSTVGLTSVDTKIAAWLVPGSVPLAGASFPDPAIGIVQLACNDDESGTQTLARFLVPNEPFTNVYIQLGNHPPNSPGTGEIRLTEHPPQSRDGCVYDDGSSEISLGTSGGGDMVWLQAFDESCGFNFVDGVDLAFGAFGSTDVPVGTPVTVLLYEDPDDDYLPDDLVLVATGTGTIQSPHTDTFENFTFTNGSVEVEGVYFIGAVVTHADGAFPAAGDLQVRQMQRHLYWTDTFSGQGYRMPLNPPLGGGGQLVRRSPEPQDVAIDQIGDRLWFHEETTNSIQVSGLDGRNVSTISGSFSTPILDISLNAIRDRAYVVVPGLGTQTDVLTLGGAPAAEGPLPGGVSGVADPLTGDFYLGLNPPGIQRFDSAGVPVGGSIAVANVAIAIAVDSLANRLYSNQIGGTLIVSAVDGSGAAAIAPFEAGARRCCVTVNPFGFLYWREENSLGDVIIKANLDGSSPVVLGPAPGMALWSRTDLATDLLGERSYVGSFVSGSFDPAAAFVPLSMNDLGFPWTWMIRPHEGPAIIRPANDDCANAIALPSSFATTPYDATNATTDGSDAAGFCDYGAFGDEINHKDIWFTYTPDVGGCTYITTLNISGYDTRLTVYDSTACPDDPANIIACVDEEILPAVTPFEAGLDVDLVAGQTYLIRLGTYGEGSMIAAPASIMIAAGPGADVNSGGNNPGAPGCDPFPEFCTGDGGDQMGCTDCPCVMGMVPNNAPIGSGGGCLNSSGTGTRLMASGDPSVSSPSMDAGNLRFESTGGPAFQLHILSSGPQLAPNNPMNPCFGLGSGNNGPTFDGLRCTAGGFDRNGGRGSDANGDVGMTNNGWGGTDFPPVSIADFFGYASGETRYFAIIHRDILAANCGTGLNTSQAIEVTFTP